MRKFWIIFVLLLSFSIITAEEENMFGDTSEPVTNEDRMEENAGKETNAAPAKSEKSKGGSKFQQFVHRSPEKKALAGAKVGMEVWHGGGWVFAGGHFDAFFEYNFIKNFGLQAELNFRGGGGWGMFTLPVIAQANFPLTDMFWLNAGAGLWFSTGWWGGVDGGLIVKSALEINTKVGVFVADIRYLPSFRSPYSGTFAFLVGYAVPLPF